MKPVGGDGLWLPGPCEGPAYRPTVWRPFCPGARVAGVGRAAGDGGAPRTELLGRVTERIVLPEGKLLLIELGRGLVSVDVPRLVKRGRGHLALLIV